MSLRRAYPYMLTCDYYACPGKREVIYLPQELDPLSEQAAVLPDRFLPEGWTRDGGIRCPQCSAQEDRPSIDAVVVCLDVEDPQRYGRRNLHRKVLDGAEFVSLPDLELVERMKERYGGALVSVERIQSRKLYRHHLYCSCGGPMQIIGGVPLCQLCEGIILSDEEDRA